MAMNTPETICKHNQSGYCKYQSHCKRMHVMDICQNTECDRTTCINRHPIMCKYFFNYGKCKFGSLCAYSHGCSLNTENIDKKISDLKDAQVKEIAKLNKEISELKTQVDDLKRIVEEKALSRSETSCHQFIPRLVNNSNSSSISIQTIPGNNEHVEIIPQLDGNLSPAEKESFRAAGPTFECETCHGKFSTEEEWNLHNTAHGFCCDDCEICYKTQIEADLHVLKEHPDCHYAVTYVPQSTKQLFASNLSKT